VLLYRIVSAWALVPLGWGLWRTMPNVHLAQLEPAAGPAWPCYRAPWFATYLFSFSRARGYQNLHKSGAGGQGVGPPLAHFPRPDDHTAGSARSATSPRSSSSVIRGWNAVG